jgi:hypothetical protein
MTYDTTYFNDIPRTKQRHSRFVELLAPDEGQFLLQALDAAPEFTARQQDVMTRSRRDKLGVRYACTMPLFRGYRLHRAEQRDWVFVNLRDDPLFADPDGFPVPRAVLQRLRRLRASGLEFDAIYVAHEVAPGTVPARGSLSREMLLPPPAAAARRQARALGQVSRGLWMAATLPLLASGLVAGLLAVGAAAPVLAGLDPILFGALVDPRRTAAAGEPAALFYLDHWAYDDEA